MTISKTAGLVLVALALPVLAGAQTVKREPAKPIGSVEGVDLYMAYCAVCHGKDAKGKGPAAVALKAPMPDLTQYAKAHGGKFSAADMEAVVLGKGTMTPAHGDADMPIWGPIFKSMSPDAAMATLRVNNLIKYLESIQAK